MKELITTVEENRKNPRQFFERSRRIKQGFKPQTNMMINDNKELVTDKKEIAEMFKTHFENLLNRPESISDEREDIMITEEPNIVEPTREEIANIINSLKNNKSPGKDQITAELLKQMVDDVHKVIIEIWKTETMPEEWNTAILCPIYKKGDPMLPENYRGISLLHTGYKILTTLIMERLNPCVTDIIGDHQCGFSKGKLTIDHIHTIR
jgi:hypothetical protein